MVHRNRLLLLALLGAASLSFSAGSGAQEEKPDSVPATPLIRPAPAVPATPLIRPGKAASQEPALTEVEQLVQDYDEAYGKWVEKIMAMEDVEPAKRVYPDSPVGEFFPRFRKLADAGNLQAISWVLRNITESKLPVDEAKTLKMTCLSKLCKHPEDTECMQALSMALMYDFYPQYAVDWRVGEEMLLGVFPKVKDREDQAMLMYARYSIHDRRGEKGMKMAVKLLETLEKKYAETRVGARAAGMLFSKRNLQIGMAPPSFSGVDVDGEPIQLADYRGKVTFLVFWGFW